MRRFFPENGFYTLKVEENKPAANMRSVANSRVAPHLAQKQANKQTPQQKQYKYLLEIFTSL